MKIHTRLGVAAGLIVAALSIPGSALMVPDTATSGTMENAPVNAPAGVTQQQIRAQRREQIRSAKKQLSHARAVYKTAIRAHGENSWQAKSALESIGLAQTELKMVRGLSTAAVAGGAGKTSGETATGGGRLR